MGWGGALGWVGGFGLVWFGGHPARGPTAPRRQRPKAWGATMYSGLPLASGLWAELCRCSPALSVP